MMGLKLTRVILTIIFFLAPLTFMVVAISSCQKELTGDILATTPNGQQGVPGDIAKVFATVNGQVLNESNVPVLGAVVKCGSFSATTDSMGVFYFKNIQISKKNAAVTVFKPGYFKGIRTFIAAERKSHHIKIQLLPRILSGSIDAQSGGTINLPGGGIIQFPSHAFSKPDGSIYSGNVKVYASWINPLSADMPMQIPGDLRGIRTDESEMILATFGMIGAEIEDQLDNRLKLSDNIQAAISFPIPASLLGIAPDRIPLWHFDETLNRWMEEGSATKTGNNYTGRVNKFSFWNVDIPEGFVQFEASFVHAVTQQPLANQFVKISVPGTNLSAYGYTNCYGYIIGGVPVNQPLLLEVKSLLCANSIYTANLGPYSSSQNLDTVWVNYALPQTVTISGRIIDCTGAPVSDGYFSFFSPNTGGYIVEPDNNGNFSLQVFNCPATPIVYSCKAVNNAAQLQTAFIQGTTSLTQLNLGNLQTCITSAIPDVYVAGVEKNSAAVSVAKYWKNGIPVSLSDGSRNAYASSICVTSNDDVYVVGHESDAAGMYSFARCWKNGIMTVIGNGATESSAESVTVNGNDVYVAFSENSASTGLSIAKLWKNNSVTELSVNTRDTYASSVFVSGGDVYVLGYEARAIDTLIAKIWKNGVVQNVSSGTNSTWPTSLFVSGNDVYVAGQEKLPGGHNRAVIWKNGIPQYLTNGINDDACVTDIYIDGTDVYACGRKSTQGMGEKAQFWKNGAVTVLSAPNAYSVAHNIFVKNGDVYITDNDFNLSNPNTNGRIWKNNLPANISNGPYGSSALGIFVK